MDRGYYHLACLSVPARRNGSRARLLLLGMLCLAASACSAPVSAVRVDRTVAQILRLHVGLPTTSGALDDAAVPRSFA